MALLDDDLGPALRALAQDQPLQPPDRLAAVTRRGQRLRRARALTAAATSFALIVGAGVGLAALREPAPAQPAASPITSWPDRSVKGQEAVAEGALASWRQLGNGDPTPVRWLFRGTVLVPNHDDEYVAVFLGSEQGSRVLVVSTAQRAQVDGRGSSGSDPGGMSGGISAWSSQAVPVSGRGPDHVGVYVGYGTEPYHNLLFVLADPRARHLTWRMTPLPYAPADPGSAARGDERSTDGVFTVQAGTLTGPVAITATDAHGATLGHGDLGGTLSAPQLVPPAAPDAPAGMTRQSALTGQSSVNPDGTWSGFQFQDLDTVTGRIAGYVRCYGGGLMRLELADAGGNHVVARDAAVACDGTAHRAFPPHTAPQAGLRGFMVIGTSDRLQVYALRVGTVR